MEVTSELSEINEKFFHHHIPKFETQVKAFLEKYPEHDGKGIKIAIWDSGIDPAASGFQQTSHGEKKIIGLYDTTGSGDVDTSHVVNVARDGPKRIVTTLSDRKIEIPENWSIDDGCLHIGVKALAELLPSSAMSRVTKDFREKQWEPEVRRLLANLRQRENDKGTTETTPPGPEMPLSASSGNGADKKSKESDEVTFTEKAGDAKVRSSDVSPAADGLHKKLLAEDKNAKDEFLKQCLSNKFPYQGPLLDIFVFRSFGKWRAVVDTSPYGGPGLSEVEPMFTYSDRFQYYTLPGKGLMSYTVNIYDDGNLLELVTTCSAHGTHVGSIAAGYFPENPARNGIAPGAQVVSFKIGDSRLNGMETGVALCRAVLKTIELGCDIVNLSYGEPSMISNIGEVSNMINEMVLKHGIIFCSSSGNNGPALSTVGSPGSTTEEGFGIAPLVFPDMSSHGYSIATTHVPPPMSYTWASRGPSTDGGTGILVSAPGGAIASTPQWTLSCSSLMNGSSMSSPNACGAIALLLSAMKANLPSVQRSPHLLRVALEATAKLVFDVEHEGDVRLSQGAGLIQVQSAYEFIETKYVHSVLSKEVGTGRPVLLQDYRVRMWTDGLDNGASSYTAARCRGIYLREFHDTSLPCKPPVSQRVFISAHFHENLTEEQQAVLELPILLKCDASWVTCPSLVSLSSRERSFVVAVDVAQLAVNQLHLTHLNAFHRDYVDLGPVATLPITVIMPLRWPSNEPIQPSMHGKFTFSSKNKLSRVFYSFPDSITAINLSLFEIPKGNDTNSNSPSESESQNVTLELHTGRTYRSHLVQLVPGDTYAAHSESTAFTIPFTPPMSSSSSLQLDSDLKNCIPAPLWETVYTLAPGQRTVEWCLARTWDQCGDLLRPDHQLGWRIDVLGLHTVPNSLTLHADCENAVRLDVHCTVAPQPTNTSKLTISPSVTFQHAVTSLPVKSSDTFCLPCDRDHFPLAKQMYALENKYTVDLSKATEVSFQCPLLSNLLYESPLQTQMWIVSDENNRFHFAGDYKSVEKYKKKLEPGQYTVRLRIHHFDKEILQKMRSHNLLMFTVLGNGNSVPASELLIRDSEPALLDAYLGLASVPGAKNALNKRPIAPGRHLQLWFSTQLSSKTISQYAGACMLKGKLSLLTDETYKQKVTVPFHLILPGKKSSPATGDSSDAEAAKGRNNGDVALKPLQKKLKSLLDAVKKEHENMEKQRSRLSGAAAVSDVASYTDGHSKSTVSLSSSTSPDMFVTPQSLQSHMNEVLLLETSALHGCQVAKLKELQMCVLAVQTEILPALPPTEQQECVQQLRAVYGEHDLRYLSAGLTCAKTLDEMLPIADVILQDPQRHLILAKSHQKNQDLLPFIDELLEFTPNKQQLSITERGQLITRALTSLGLAICHKLQEIRQMKRNCEEKSEKETVTDVVHSTDHPTEEKLKLRLQTIFCELCCWNERHEVGSANASKPVTDLAEFWWRHALTMGYFGRALKLLVAINEVRPSRELQRMIWRLMEKLGWTRLAEWVCDFYRHKYFKKPPVF